MSHKGFSHLGFSTLDLDKTREFYEGILGFKPVRCDTIKIKEGGQIRHIFFDTGRDQLIAFMEAQKVPGVPAEYDAGREVPPRDGQAGSPSVALRASARGPPAGGS